VALHRAERTPLDESGHWTVCLWLLVIPFRSPQIPFLNVVRMPERERSTATAVKPGFFSNWRRRAQVVHGGTGLGFGV